MLKSAVNYQNDLLNEVRKESVPVTIFLTNGFQLKGLIKAFDNYVVFLESDGKQMMVYKHAMSTVTPVKPIRLNFSQNTEGGQSRESDG